MSGNQAVRPSVFRTGPFTLFEATNQGEAQADFSTNDSDLIGRARRGDRTAFGLLYERYARLAAGLECSAEPRPSIRQIAAPIRAPKPKRDWAQGNRKRFSATVVALQD